MLCGLSNTPATPEQWSVWGWDHRSHHDLIRQAILSAGGPNLQEVPLDPIDFSNIQQWLEWNQRSHSDINGVLGVQSSDLEQVDFNNPQQLEAWIYLHRREHESWSAVLKV